MPDGQSGGWKRIYDGKDFLKRCVLSLEWKRVGVWWMVRVLMMEQVGQGEWNERSRKENCPDAVDGVKQEDYWLALAYSLLN